MIELLAAASPYLIGLAWYRLRGRRPLVVIGEWLIRLDHNLRCVPGAVRAGVEWYRVQQRIPR